jgi:protein O-mannosyl-transferase
MTVVNEQVWGPLGSESAVLSRAGVATQSADGSAGHRRGSWLLRCLVLFVVAAYLPVLRNGFVDWDDDANFLTNFNYRGLTPASLIWAWTTNHLGVYQPVAWMILSVEYVLGGMDSRVYHFASVLLHALNAITLYYLSLALLRRAWPESIDAERRAARIGSALAAAVFAVHPLRVEVVAWASCQPYLPCALFCMLTVLAYLRAIEVDDRRKHWAWLCVACLLFGLALLSKAAAVGLAAILLVLDIYPLSRLPVDPRRWFASESRGVLWEKVPFVAITAIFVGLAIHAKQDVESLAPIRLNWAEWSSRLAQAAYGTCFYPAKIILPVGLSPFYPLPEGLALTAWPFNLCVAVIIGIGVVLLRFSRRWPGLLASFVSYLILLSPNLGIIRIGDQIVADRYGYIASISLAVLLAYCLSQLVRPGLTSLRAKCMVVVLCSVLLGLIPLTWFQCRIWRNPKTLWTQAYRLGARRSAEVNSGMAVGLVRQDQWSEAVPFFEESIRTQEINVSNAPNSSVVQGMLGATLSNLGLTLSQVDQLEKARSTYQHAIVHETLACKLRPDHSIYRHHLAIHFRSLADVEKKLGRNDDAMESLKHAREQFEPLVHELPKDPGPLYSLVTVYYEIGLLQQQEGLPAEALTSIQRARELRERLVRTYPNTEGLGEELARYETEIRASHGISGTRNAARSQTATEP